MDNERLFSFMKKMYNEMQSMKTEMQQGFKCVNDRLDKVENEIKKTNIVIENEIKPKIEALFDGYKQNNEQTDIKFNEILITQDNTNTLISSSVKIVSDDVKEIKQEMKELKEKFDKVEKVTMQNTYDVAYLKQVK
jgi:tetrahydromethanopterin S-methyltransferase subunit G